MVRVLGNGPEDRDTFSGQVIPNTLKLYLVSNGITLSLIRYRSRVSVAIQGTE